MTLVMFVPLALLVAAVLCALGLGGKPERLGAGLLFAWFVADLLLRHFSAPRAYVGFSLPAAILDLLAFFGFVVLALRANRLWPIFAAAFLTFPVLGHIAMLAEVRGMNWAYWAMTQIPPNAVAVAILIASVKHSGRLRRGREVRDWRLN